MRSVRALFKRQAASFATILLCLWLSGAACALNCGFAVVAAAETAIEADDANLPPCHRRAKAKKTENTKDDFSFAKTNVTPVSNCCPVLSASFVPAKNVKFEFAPLSPLEAKLNIAPQSFRREIVFDSNYKPLPQSRDSTYLKNRSLLI